MQIMNEVSDFMNENCFIQKYSACVSKKKRNLMMIVLMIDSNCIDWQFMNGVETMNETI